MKREYMSLIRYFQKQYNAFNPIIIVHIIFFVIYDKINLMPN